MDDRYHSGDPVTLAGWGTPGRILVHYDSICLKYESVRQFKV